MSLTTEALYRRKWGWLPSLEQVLGKKRLPDRLYGPSTVSDNIFESLPRLWETFLLVHENRAEVALAMSADPERFSRDLDLLASRLRNIAEMFEKATMEIQSIRPPSAD